MEPINRKLLKEHAKQVMKHNFWMAILICFLGSLLGAEWSGLGGNSSGGSFRFRNTFSSSSDTYKDTDYADFNVADSAGLTTRAFLDEIEQEIQQTDKGQDFYYNYDLTRSETDNIKNFFQSVLDYYHISNQEMGSFLLIAGGIVLLIFVLIWAVITAITFAIGSFIGAPIGVGQRKYFMKNRQKTSSFDDLFSSFSGGHYMDIVKSMFSTNIRIWGWSLLFYFPGLVKSYQYYFVSYIMAENPLISKERARELSKQMTDGHKWQIFVLQLSFLGWAMVFVLEEILLALISCGLLAIPGALLIYPLIVYEKTTYAELYEERREYALMTGMANGEELTGF